MIENIEQGEANEGEQNNDLAEQPIGPVEMARLRDEYTVMTEGSVEKKDIFDQFTPEELILLASAIYDEGDGDDEKTSNDKDKVFGKFYGLLARNEARPEEQAGDDSEEASKASWERLSAALKKEGLLGEE